MWRMQGVFEKLRMGNRMTVFPLFLSRREVVANRLTDGIVIKLSPIWLTIIDVDYSNRQQKP